MSLKSDLIFHVVSRRKWRDLNKGGYYKPEDFHEKEFVECVTAGDLNSFLNDRFQGRKNLLILVIDLYRLSSRYKKHGETGRVHIMGGVNTDAILDKIRIDCNTDGSFDVEVGDK
ncbi:DUF952 domain-containing protein [Rhodohalobacter mucosus]|uniref:Uncharacterized protein n=1 Tax=Rhodohalobacter mucosus TaxID=2079485 RepID=A0A316TSK0_9BACT|nr:DUF952 domain-containing protein [Rhodohalobacter mucosus]PWN07557.1 hypothetical protein DDZ15_04690 [Rhodohalobacter mucosus]